MKALVLGWMLVAAAACADNVALKNGVVLRGVKIVSADESTMTVASQSGIHVVAYTDLAPNALTPALRDHLVLRMQEHQKRHRGMVRFEGAWMLPSEREKVLQVRAAAELDREKTRLEIAELEARKGISGSGVSVRYGYDVSVRDGGSGSLRSGRRARPKVDGAKPRRGEDGM